MQFSAACAFTNKCIYFHLSIFLRTHKISPCCAPPQVIEVLGIAIFCLMKRPTYPAQLPLLVPKCIRGSLEANLISSFHSFCHSSSVYTRPDYNIGRDSEESKKSIWKQNISSRSSYFRGFKIFPKTGLGGAAAFRGLEKRPHV